MQLKTCERCGKEFGPKSQHKNTLTYFKKRRFCSQQCAGLETRPRTDDPEKLFWERVDKRGEDECWEWKRARQRAGYGAMTVHHKVLTMHRFSWELHNGPIPPGAHVLHKCDNPPCCNPKHLFLGNPKINAEDRMAKGRHRSNPNRGEAHHRSKLTEAGVRDIRSSDVPARLAAIAYGVTATTIYMVRNRLIWKHVE